MEDLLAVYTTVPSSEEAQRIAQAMVERRLAACAQITQIESCYLWDGTLQREAEWRLLFKSTAAQYAALETAIRELHSYELPAIHAVAIDRVFEPYAAWVRGGSSGSPGS